MKCPSCGNYLEQYRYHKTVVDGCAGCGGIWFDPGEMQPCINFLLKEREDIPDAKIELGKKVVAGRRIQKDGKSCPRCEEALEPFNYAYDSNIILDRCLSCGGVWTDKDEIYKLAVHVKGNPRLRAMGEAILENKRQMQKLTEMAEFSGSFGGNAGIWVYLPKVVIPIGDDVRTKIFPVSVISIIAVNIVSFIYQVLFVSDLHSFFMAYGMVPAAVVSGEAYSSLVTSMFLHAGVLHLAGNMFFFWIFADNIEEALGHVQFIIFYFLFGFLASLLHIVSDMHSAIPAVGASGAIAGVMGAYFVLFPRANLRTLFVHRVIDVPAYVYLGGWMALQLLYGMLSLSAGLHSGVAWFAHIGGFLGGVVLMLPCRTTRSKK